MTVYVGRVEHKFIFDKMNKYTHSTRYLLPSRYEEFDYEINSYMRKRLLVPRHIPKSKLNGKNVVLGTLNDPYNKDELEYENTKQLLKFLMNIDCSLTIMTNSLLVLRDLDILKELKQTPTICVKISTLDETFREFMEKDSTPISERLKLLKDAHDNGLKTICYIYPIYPFMTEPLNIINIVKDFSDSMWVENFKTTVVSKNLTTLMSFIKRYYPSLKSVYIKTFYNHKDEYWVETWQMIKDYCTRNNMIGKIHNRIKYSVPIYFR